MNKKMFRKLVIFAIIILSLVLVGCQKSEKSASDTDKPYSVVATIGMIGDIATNLAAEYVEVTTLMGAGVDPHLYKASANDVKLLYNADLILYGGLHLEGKMSDVLDSLSSTKRTVAASEAIPDEYLIGHSGSHDPHVWFDVSLWLYAVDAIYTSLIDLLPEHNAEITENYNSYKVQLQQLHAYVQETSNTLDKEQRVLITAHDAFEYFGKAYDFEVRGLQGTSTVSEAGTRDVQDLAQYIVDHKIKAIFIESSVPVKTIQSLQEAVKAKGFNVVIGGELFSDAMGDTGTKEGTYIGMVEHNINTIVSALAL
jgi:manganese/zinc/iron transport system substrate-binding protein